MCTQPRHRPILNVFKLGFGLSSSGLSIDFVLIYYVMVPYPLKLLVCLANCCSSVSGPFNVRINY